MAILKATTSFATPDATGRKRHVDKGTLVDSDDLVVKRLPELFEPVEKSVVEVLGTASRPAVLGVAKRPAKKV
jgi:hypothetical protein